MLGQSEKIYTIFTKKSTFLFIKFLYDTKCEIKHSIKNILRKYKNKCFKNVK